MLQTSFFTRAPKEKAFNFIASIDAMELFQGSKLVPGIKEVKQEGDILLIRDSWGMIHREKLISSPSRLLFIIEPNRLIRLLIKRLEETWKLEEIEGGTRVHRSFLLRPRPWSKFLLPFLYNRLQAVIRKNNERIILYLAMQNISVKRSLL